MIPPAVNLVIGQCNSGRVPTPLVSLEDPMFVATPVTPEGQSAPSWGKAHWIGVAEVADGEITSWRIDEVAWDVSHDAGTHGSHHARIVRFLKDESIDAVVVDHMGEGMVRVMNSMGIPILSATPGDARASILKALEAARTIAS